MTSDPVRAQFEAWAKETGYSLYRHNGAAYSSFLTQNVWAAWKAALAAQEGGGGDEYQSAITQDQVDRARNAFFKKMMLGFGVDDCFFAALRAAQEGTGNAE